MALPRVLHKMLPRAIVAALVLSALWPMKAAAVTVTWSYTQTTTTSTSPTSTSSSPPPTTMSTTTFSDKNYSPSMTTTSGTSGGSSTSSTTSTSLSGDAVACQACTARSQTYSIVNSNTEMSTLACQPAADSIMGATYDLWAPELQVYGSDQCSRVLSKPFSPEIMKGLVQQRTQDIMRGTHLLLGLSQSMRSPAACQGSGSLLLALPVGTPLLGACDCKPYMMAACPA
jgi:hypothetical protein